MGIGGFFSVGGGGGGHELKLCWWGQNLNFVLRRGVKNQMSEFFLGVGVIVCSKKHTSEYVHFSRHVSVKKFHYFI